MTVEINPINISWLSDKGSRINEIGNKTNGNSFKTIFDNAVNNVKSTESELQKQQYMLATGQTDNPHLLPIAAAKAQLSVDMLVQLRNKTVEAYNELMRINL